MDWQSSEVFECGKLFLSGFLGTATAQWPLPSDVDLGFQQLVKVALDVVLYHHPNIDCDVILLALSKACQILTSMSH